MLSTRFRLCNMVARSNPGRVAGCLYLLTGFSMVRPMYVARTLIWRDDAAATVRNIAAQELLSVSASPAI